MTETKRDNRRNLVYYRRWMELANHYHVLGFEPDTIMSIVRKTGEIIEECRGYHYEHIAISSGKSMELVFKDKGWL